MAIGSGYLDPQGIWRYGEDDLETLASDLLDLGQASVSAQLALDRVRLTDVEELATGVMSTPVGFTIGATNDLYKTRESVTINANIVKNTGTFTSNTQIATLHSDFWPAKQVDVSCSFANVTNGWATIDTVGQVKIFFLGAASNQVFFNATFRA